MRSFFCCMWSTGWVVASIKRSVTAFSDNYTSVGKHLLVNEKRRYGDLSHPRCEYFSWPVASGKYSHQGM